MKGTPPLPEWAKKNSPLSYFYCNLTLDWMMDETAIGMDHFQAVKMLQRSEVLPIVIFSKMWWFVPATYLFGLMIVVNYYPSIPLLFTTLGSAIFISLICMVVSMNWNRNVFLYGVMDIFLKDTLRVRTPEAFIAFCIDLCKMENIISPKYISPGNFKRLVTWFDVNGIYTTLE